MTNPPDVTGMPDLPVTTAPADAPAREHLDRAFVHGLAWTGGARWTAQIAMWTATLALARLLSPADFGVWALATVYLGIVTLVSEFGLGSSVVMIRDLVDEQIAQINGFAILMGLAAVVLSCAAAWPLGWLLDSDPLPPIIIALSGVFVVTSLRIVPQALLQKELRFKLLALVDATKSVAQAVALVTFALLGFGYWTLALGALAAEITATTILLLVRRHAILKPRLDSIRHAVSFSSDVMLSRIAWYLYSNSDFLVAGRLLGEGALGAYSMAWSMAGIPVEKVTSLVMTVTPAFLSAVQKDLAELRRYVLTLTEGVSLLTFPAAAGLAMVSELFVPVVLSPKWQASIVPLRLLAIYAAVRTISPILAPVLTAVGDTRFVMWNNLLALILLPVSFAIGTRWGVGGVAAAWLLVHPFTLIFLYRRTFNRIELTARAYLGSLWPALSGLIGMAAAVFAVHEIVSPAAAQPLRFGLEVAAGALGYGTVLLTLHRQRVMRLKTVFQALRRRR